MAVVTTHEAVASPSGGPVGRPVRRLLVASALMLFAELVLIRWLGANVVHLSYFTNFVLLGSFLGIGVGFLLSSRQRTVLPISATLLALLVLLVYFLPTSIERGGSNLIYFTTLETGGPPAWLVLPLLFVLVAAVLAGPAQEVGRCFAQLEPLTAYRYDLVGSLLGIAVFTALSFLRAPSVVWGVLVAAGFLALAPAARLIVTSSACALVVGVLLLESTTAGVSWSPYYKVTTQDLTDHGVDVVDIAVNGIPHQVMAPAAWKLEYGEEQYAVPYERAPGNALDEVLIVGAGSGSDVAIALSKGAQHVDAVDIDPRILQIGAQTNPDQAYGDPRVSAHVGDGRAFLERTDKKYDLILFALPDSLALVNGASHIRLESFLFTSQALASARAHLAPGGSFAMYNYYREPWLIDRLVATAGGAFGHQPCVDTFREHQAVISIALDPAEQSCGDAYQATTSIGAVSDDAPFLYYRGGQLPAFYLWALAGIIGLALVAARVFGGPFRAMRPYADLFLMGVAFLLLETKNVATFALLFGTTWLVNAFVFAGVLGIVLAAVETTRRFRTPRLPVVFGALGLSLIAAWAVEPAWLLGMPYLPRLLVATALAFLPIYLANIAFAKRFAESSDSRTAFGVNLLGAIVGGCLEYGAIVTGYRNLLVVVAVIYVLAFVAKPRSARLA